MTGTNGGQRGPPVRTKMPAWGPARHRPTGDAEAAHISAPTDVELDRDLGEEDGRSLLRKDYGYSSLAHANEMLYIYAVRPCPRPQI